MAVKHRYKNYLEKVPGNWEEPVSSQRKGSLGEDARANDADQGQRDGQSSSRRHCSHPFRRRTKGSAAEVPFGEVAAVPHEKEPRKAPARPTFSGHGGLDSSRPAKRKQALFRLLVHCRAAAPPGLCPTQPPPLLRSGALPCWVLELACLMPSQGRAGRGESRAKGGSCGVSAGTAASTGWEKHYTGPTSSEEPGQSFLRKKVQ
ncbi:UNVERIFIED_CONTAM: hypothetical protein K2H54_051395 [Gekko kuhli]